MKLRFNLNIAGANAVSQLVPLELMRAGEEGRIRDIDGRPHLVTRLQEMGLHSGAVVRMVQPGSPCIIAVDNHRLSFRSDDAAMILVESGLLV